MRKLSKLFFILLIITPVLFTISCGRKGSPKPPEESSPASVRFFQLSAKSKSVITKFQAPLETAGGDELIDLSSFSIRKRLVGKDASSYYEEIAVLDFDPEIHSQKDTWFEYEDTDVKLGSQYEYIVLPKDYSGYKGLPPFRLRVTFVGEGTVIENLPIEEE